MNLMIVESIQVFLPVSGGAVVPLSFPFSYAVGLLPIEEGIVWRNELASRPLLWIIRAPKSVGGKML